ncbi:Adenosine deaminase/editase [Kalmanozyma brasiliensis GHG001]|uniref:Adenosine deaminase/editase n=1 Tax=Kalmanozyma brasiliensis (strain GHG001) TaxID=1365824 RepID=UPI00286801A6|nr:Adenosine deaminase/editase [Kalmanozyma brasiliensis GHG001]KAF6767423.1 Adenosine deaminase/editase [Kalmanozyma brasiliensis GHG001]
MATRRSEVSIDHERIAALVLETYLKHLPPRGAKPGIKSNNRLEWTVLAAFVLSYPFPQQDSQYAVVSLATGLKCLPCASLPPNGDVLHDQHAEVLARRGARQWLLQRLQEEVKAGAASGPTLFEQVESDESARRWKLKAGVRLHLYVSTLPCGDASNKLLDFQRAAQDQIAGRSDVLTTAELLELELQHSFEAVGGGSGQSSVVRGRASSSHSQATNPSPGSLRTKPGRPDSPPSICMSCSDKIALWNAPGIGMQGSLLSLLLDPIYVSSITICDHPVRHIFPTFPTSSVADAESSDQQREALKEVLAKDCERALQRARPADDGNAIAVGWSTTPFPDSKEAQMEKAWSTFESQASGLDPADHHSVFRANHEPESCPNSVLFISHASLEPGKGKIENLATGTKMGAPTKRPKSKEGQQSEPLKPPARSGVCRLSYFQSFISAYDSMMGTAMRTESMLYSDAKAGTFGEGTRAYRRRKDGLLGRKGDVAVEAFLRGARNGTGIKDSAQPQDVPPVSDSERTFNGWLRTPDTLSRFDLDGRTFTHSHRRN